MNKYEKLIEYVINKEDDKASELFHKIVVENSRDIYENLLNDEIGGNEAEDFVRDVENEIGAEEDGMEMDGDMEMDGEEPAEEEIEERVSDVEVAIDELQAEFDALMGDEAEEGDHDISDMDGDGDLDMEPEMDSDMDYVDNEEEMMMEEEDDDEECNEDDDEEEDESIIKEYVDTVADAGMGSEGKEVGKGKSASVNKKSTVAGKNDMGGSAKNIAQGKENTGSNAEKAKEDNMGNRNVPGGKAGRAYNKSESPAVTKDEASNKKSILKKAGK